MSKTLKNKSHSQVGISGQLLVEIKDAKSGKTIQSWIQHNLVVNDGLRLIRDMIGADIHKAPTDIWIGTNDSVPVASDTVNTIQNPFKKAITARVQTSFGVAFQVFISESEANGFTYNEAALVNSRNQTDTLFSRVNLSPNVVKTASVTVTLTWTVTVKRAE